MTAAQWRLGFWLFTVFGLFGAGAGTWGWKGFIFTWMCLGVGYNLHKDQVEVDRVHDEEA